MKPAATTRAPAHLWRTPAYVMWKNAATRAQASGVPFLITPADIPPTPDFCPVLGLKLAINTQGAGARRGASDCSPSLDRIVPELGYIPGNVRIVSMRANRIRSNATSKELIAIAADCYALEADLRMRALLDRVMATQNDRVITTSVSA